MDAAKAQVDAFDFQRKAAGGGRKLGCTGILEHTVRYRKVWLRILGLSPLSTRQAT